MPKGTHNALKLPRGQVCFLNTQAKELLFTVVPSGVTLYSINTLFFMGERTLHLIIGCGTSGEVGSLRRIPLSLQILMSVEYYEMCAHQPTDKQDAKLKMPSHNCNYYPLTYIWLYEIGHHFTLRRLKNNPLEFNLHMYVYCLSQAARQCVKQLVLWYYY